MSVLFHGNGLHFYRTINYLELFPGVSSIKRVFDIHGGYCLWGHDYDTSIVYYFEDMSPSLHHRPI